MKMHASIKVEGAVQGVFFRDSVEKQASEMHLTGYVRNADDGSVYIEAEGEPDVLEQFLTWCKRGTDKAHVSNVSHEFSNDIKGFEKFLIEW